MFKNLLGLVENVVKIAIAPVEIVVAAAKVVTQPVADILEDITEEIR